MTPSASLHSMTGVLSHVGGEKVPWIRDLALVSHVQPTPGEDALQLLFIDAKVAETGPVH